MICGIVYVTLAIRFSVAIDILSEHSPLDEREVFVHFLFEERVGTIGEAVCYVLFTFEGGETFGATLLFSLSLCYEEFYLFTLLLYSLVFLYGATKSVKFCETCLIFFEQFIVNRSVGDIRQLLFEGIEFVFHNLIVWILCKDFLTGLWIYCQN